MTKVIQINAYLNICFDWQISVPGRKIWLWNILMLYSIRVYVRSYSAIAAAEGFKSPEVYMNEYVLTLLAAAWARVHEILLVPYQAASVWDTLVYVHLSDVNAHSRDRDTAVRTSSETAHVLWDFCQCLFQRICIITSWFLPDYFFKSRRITEVDFCNAICNEMMWILNRFCTEVYSWW